MIANTPADLDASELAKAMTRRLRLENQLWQATHPDYRSVGLDGRRRVLILEQIPLLGTKRTRLVPLDSLPLDRLQALIDQKAKR